MEIFVGRVGTTCRYRRSSTQSGQLFAFFFFFFFFFFLGVLASKNQLAGHLRLLKSMTNYAVYNLL